MKITRDGDKAEIEDKDGVMILSSGAKQFSDKELEDLYERWKNLGK